MKYFFAIIILLTSFFAHATDYYVSNTGSDSNSGTAIDSPFKTIAHAVTLLQAGDVLYIRGGEYREVILPSFNQDGVLNNPITVTSYNGEDVLIKGSAVISGFTAFSNGTIPLSDGVYSTPWNIESQQVFVEDNILRQVGHVADKIAGVASDGFWMIEENGNNPNGNELADLSNAGNEKSFFYDKVNQVLYVRYNGLNPNDFLVEASSKEVVVNIRESDYFHIKGIKFRHCNSSTRYPNAALVELGNFSVLEDCEIQWADQSGISMGYQREGARVVNCIVNHNGNNGTSASLSNDFSIIGSTFNYNNYRKFNPLWHAGGIKIVSDSWGKIENNEIAFNYGSGLWFDYCDSNDPSFVIANNIHDNGPKHAGLFLEVSRNITVYNNIINNNSRLGIAIEASDFLRIINNEILNTHGELGVAGVAGLRISRDPLQYSTTLSNIFVYNNILYNNKQNCQYDVYVVADNPTHGIEKIYFDNNLYYNSDNAYVFYKGTTTNDFATWQSFGVDANGMAADPEYDNLAASINKKSTSPTIDAAINIGYVSTDYYGNARPSGISADIGASELLNQGATNTPPIANAGQDFEVSVDESFQLSAALSTDSDGSITSYTWKEGNNQIYSGPDATYQHSFAEAGVYTIELIVADNLGAQSIDMITVHVKLNPGELLLHWDFEDGAGVVQDLSTHNNNGVLNSGAAYVSPGHNDGAGYALSVDGLTGNAYCQYPSVTAVEALTVMAWMHPNSSPDKWLGGISKQGAWDLRANGNDGGNTTLKWVFSLQDVNYNFHVLSSTTELDLNTWHHIVGTYDGSKMKIYIDGVLDVETPNPASYEIKVGSRVNAGFSSGRMFFGKIDEFKWYNSALSDQEITDEYNTSLNPLPISMIGFSGYKRDEKVLLKWTTASEIDFEGFGVERSMDGLHWESIGFVRAKGDVETRKNYQYFDKEPKEGLNYYRLKEQDWNGRYKFSNTISVSFESSGIVIYPNPAKDQIFITSKAGAFDKIMIYNHLGELVLSQNQPISALDISHFPKGTYTLVTQSKSKLHSKLFVVE